MVEFVTTEPPTTTQSLILTTILGQPPIITQGQTTTEPPTVTQVHITALTTTTDIPISISIDISK